MANASLLILEEAAREVRVLPLEKNQYTIGRAGQESADIILALEGASCGCGTLVCRQGQWFYRNGGDCGVVIDGRRITGGDSPYPLNDGAALCIGGGGTGSAGYQGSGALILFCAGDYSNQKWMSYPLGLPKDPVTVGRDEERCQVVIHSVSVSREHGQFYTEYGALYYKDLKGMGDTIANGKALRGACRLVDGDVLMIGHIKMMLVCGVLFYMQSESGGRLSIRGLTRRVGDARHWGRKKTILDDVNLDINASELVAVLGASGSGKTTFINCVIGYEEATGGKVILNGVDLYKHKRMLKKQFGYAPQDDLLRNGLSVVSTLKYVARLRLPKDVSKTERMAAIDHVMGMLDLEPELKYTDVRKISGGQRKRVSIATELISDPPLLFLDEPTAGLDPEMESNLIHQLHKLAHQENKTIIVVTNTVKNIDLFDKLLFIGPGGKACYFGSPMGALAAFGVTDITDVYPLVRERTAYYASRYKRSFTLEGGVG